jgi:hypothetical protein
MEMNVEENEYGYLEGVLLANIISRCVTVIIFKVIKQIPYSEVNRHSAD